MDISYEEVKKLFMDKLNQHCIAFNTLSFNFPPRTNFRYVFIEWTKTPILQTAANKKSIKFLLQKQYVYFTALSTLSFNTLWIAFP